MENDENQSSISSTADEGEKIRELAYRFWQERGCPIDSPEEDWFRAQREVASANGAGE
jgi:hypothetical protein